MTVPVYEVYKVGEDPRWVAGLDLLGPLGLAVALIPHYDNAEGGTHDTRFCYLGEERLAGLEDELPEGIFVLGVDEHTALCLDLDARTAAVAGHGGVTVRARGRSARIESGADLPIDRIAEMADDLAAELAGGSHRGDRRPAKTAEARPGTDRAAAGPAGARVPRSSTPSGATRRPSGGGRDASDVAAMVERHPGARGRDVGLAGRHAPVRRDRPGAGQPAGDGRRARASWPSPGARDPAAVVGPFVELALALRDGGAPGRALRRRRRRARPARGPRHRGPRHTRRFGLAAPGRPKRRCERRGGSLLTCERPDRSSPHRLAAEDAALSRR